MIFNHFMKKNEIRIEDEYKSNNNQSKRKKPSNRKEGLTNIEEHITWLDSLPNQPEVAAALSLWHMALR